MVELIQLNVPSKRWHFSRLRMLVFVACLTLVTALVSGFLVITRSPTDLGHAGRAATAEWLSAWKAGEIVALVRHEERCDRSTNTCLGPADGITKLGSDSAASIGRGFVNLGMQQAQVFSSPLTRTMQTAQFMFGEEAVAQDWLEICGPTFRDDIAAHKTAQRNLVLVTHSGCIGDFEKQTGYPHAIPAAYGSALLMRIDAKGDLKVLGILNPDAWAQFKKQ